MQKQEKYYEFNSAIEAFDFIYYIAYALNEKKSQGSTEDLQKEFAIAVKNVLKHELKVEDYQKYCSLAREYHSKNEYGFPVKFTFIEEPKE